MTGRLLRQLPVRNRFHCLNFGEAVKIVRSSNQPLIVRVRSPLRLTMRIIDKIITTIERLS
jgi:hypothetical protein